MTRRTCLVFVLALAVAGATGAQQGPSPELRSRISGLGEVLGAYDPASPEPLDALRLEAFTPDLQKKISAAEFREMAARIRADYGAFGVEGVRRRDLDTVELVISSATGKRGQIVLGLERVPPHLITSIAVIEGEAQGNDGGPVPAIDGRMTPVALSGVLDDFFGSLARKDQFSGVVLVARDGTPVFERGFGMAVREQNRPNTPATRFNIGSINKAFTRAALAQLMGEGKLALTDTIGQILPGYPNKDAHRASIGQLLDHSGGIANFFGAPFQSVPRSSLASNADYMRLVAPLPLTFPPGTDSRYCNGCYIVLGEVIARVSATTYENYVRNNIFEKAGMRTAGFLDDAAPDVAMGYTRRDGALLPNQSLRGARGSAAGGAYATAADLLAYDNALREGRLLDPKMSGWYLGGDSIRGGRAREGVGVAGGTLGVNASLNSDGTWTVVVLSNFDPPFAEEIAAVIFRRLRN